jgi:hypothetical protein
MSTALKIGPQCLVLTLCICLSPVGCKKANVPTNAHAIAATEVFHLLYRSPFFLEAAETSWNESEKRGPDFEARKKEFLRWIDTVYADKEFENRTVQILMKDYSESELQELAKFYRSAVGQKYMRIDHSQQKAVREAIRKVAESHVGDYKNPPGGGPPSIPKREGQ